MNSKEAIFSTKLLVNVSIDNCVENGYMNYLMTEPLEKIVEDLREYSGLLEKADIDVVTLYTSNKLRTLGRSEIEP